MLRGLLICLWMALTVFASAYQVGSPAPLRVGDEIGITVSGASDASGSYVVQNDGFVYLPRLGRVLAKGKNVDQLAAAITSRAKGYVKFPRVSVSLRRQKPQPVYVIGGNTGVVELQPGMGIREVIALTNGALEADQFNVSLYRSGAKLFQTSLADIVFARGGSWNRPLQADDMLIVEPVPFVRVWVTGAVRIPGKLKLKKGEDVYQAVAAAGDLSERPEVRPLQRSEYSILVRRGPDSFQFPLVPDAQRAPFPLEEGDTLSVQPVQLIRVTLSGEVRRPGESIISTGTSVATLLASTGGPTAEGTAREVLLFRKGEVRFVNAVPPREGQLPSPTPSLEEGDVVFVPKSERVFYVYGEVARSGRILMSDDRSYRLADVLAEAGGLNGLGTFRRVSIVRKGEGDRLDVKHYNLDEYLRDGKLASNPAIESRDVIVFDRSRGISFNQILNLATSVLFLDSLIRR